MANRRITSPESTARHSPWSWAIWGALLGLFGAVILFAPASWVGQGVLRASGGHFQLHESQGTIWQGSAKLVLTGGPDSNDATGLPGRVQWNLRPAWTGLQIALRADCCTPQPQQLLWVPGLRRWSLQVMPAESAWPMALLSGLGTPWNTVQLQGNVQIKTPGLTLTSAVDRMQLDGSLSLEMPDTASRLSTLRPLGSYRLQLQGGERPTLELQTVKGSLQLQGTGQWTAAHLRFVGEARADAAHEAELSNLLNILGRRDGARSVITLG